MNLRETLPKTGQASYWAAASIAGDRGEDELTELVRGIVAEDADGRSWRWHRAGPWLHLAPPGFSVPRQGWKLHLSATTGSARAVLAAVAPILLRERTPFKLTATLAHLARLNNASTPREAAGKFITIYPRDDEQARRLAGACDAVTRGLSGPSILSDRPFRPGSLVHYRYGGFAPEVLIDEDGSLVDTLRDPEGAAVPDARSAWFQPPPWATSPFDEARRGRSDETAEAGRTSEPRSPRAVLLNGRYLVRAALKHSNRGGVYRAEDRDTGGAVVIKEARPHVEAWGRSVDVREVLRHEARMLRAVEHLGLAPRVEELFEQQDHLFLVLELLRGTTLREHVAERFEPGGRRHSRTELRRLVSGLAETMRAFHGAGVLLRDFTPNNVLVAPGEPPRLIDFEFAHLVADGPTPSWSVGTPGYVSPEQEEGAPTGFPDDHYALGATLVFAVSGLDPLLPADRPPGRRLSVRLREWLRRLADEERLDERVVEIALRCMEEEPTERWRPEQVLAALGEEPAPPASARASNGTPPVSLETLASLPDQIVRWLRRTMDQHGDHLWPTTCYGLSLDPCNVHTGASGVGIFLCQASELGLAAVADDMIATAARWVVDRVEHGPAGSPGLYFGRAGTAWFLADAAARLDDPRLLDRASALALSLPLAPANPDITHGAAGAGLAQLRLWRATDDPRFLERAASAAERLVSAARSGEAGVVWPVAEGGRSLFAGTTSYGFAHGNAGIVHFLLCAAVVLDDDRIAAAAREGLETLMRGTILIDGGAFWDAGPGRPTRWPHWCNGSSGVGTALLRGFAVTGEDRYRSTAELAARAVVDERWRCSLVQCHGLAGNAELVLDLRALTGDERFHRIAVELADVLYSRRVHDDGLVVFPDESGAEVTAGFSTGLAGIGSFLLRVVHASPRPLMLDELLTPRLEPSLR